MHPDHRVPTHGQPRSGGHRKVDSTWSRWSHLSHFCTKKLSQKAVPIVDLSIEAAPLPSWIKRIHLSHLTALSSSLRFRHPHAGPRWQLARWPKALCAPEGPLVARTARAPPPRHAQQPNDTSQALATYGAPACGTVFGAQIACWIMHLTRPRPRKS